ncbi:MAG: DNA repair protein RadA [Saprospiraceae bacterium]|nr:DNA repair protein RadA [Saprospiraceae bacterium]
MAKLKTIYVCNSCGNQVPKWMGHCNSCGSWNSFVEEVIEKKNSGTDLDTSQIWRKTSKQALSASTALEDVHAGQISRKDTCDPELNRVLGGGLVRGSVTLIAGQPGIGKSTLLLQMAMQSNMGKVLYVSGEESEEQIKLRANRIQKNQSGVFLFSETRVDLILVEATKLEAGLIIVDSIQTIVSADVDSSPGTISQIRECTNELVRYAKETSTPVIIIGHINKEGDIAGPKILEHTVDTVLQFEGDRHHSFRILRTLKNRFGSTDELSMYQMEEDGLHPVSNPSELLLSQHSERLSGSAVACTVEGLRPLLIETQALIGPSVYGNPQRVATGFDQRRLAMLLAVLEKRCGFSLGMQDVFLNLAGGIRIHDPGLDLAVIASLISSLQDHPLHRQICFAGEVGLSGEIRAISRVDLRIQEAERLGFKAICISKYNGKTDALKSSGIKIVALGTVNEFFEKVFQAS